MDSVKSKSIETLLLSDPNWLAGTSSGQNMIGQTRYADTLNLSVNKASEEGQKEALRLLREKYGVDAQLINSKSFDGTAPNGTWVLRVANKGPFREIEKLGAIRQLAAPSAWKLNVITDNGREQPAQNLRADRLTDLQIGHIQETLKNHGISSVVTTSQSLGGVRVVRVVGEQNIAKLADTVPTLSNLHTPTTPKTGGAPKASSELRS